MASLSKLKKYAGSSPPSSPWPTCTLQVPLPDVGHRGHSRPRCSSVELLTWGAHYSEPGAGGGLPASRCVAIAKLLPVPGLSLPARDCGRVGMGAAQRHSLRSLTFQCRTHTAQWHPGSATCAQGLGLLSPDFPRRWSAANGLGLGFLIPGEQCAFQVQTKTSSEQCHFPACECSGRPGFCPGRWRGEGPCVQERCGAGLGVVISCNPEGLQDPSWSPTRGEQTKSVCKEWALGVFQKDT